MSIKCDVCSAVIPDVGFPEIDLSVDGNETVTVLIYPKDKEDLPLISGCRDFCLICAKTELVLRLTKK